MTNKTTEALKLAEEALVKANHFHDCEDALVAVREALAEQSMVMILNDPHPPHRLCECTACLEYWTPLPDCDAFAGGGKPIDHIADTGKMVGCSYCDTNLLAGSECSNCGRVTIAEPANTRSTSEYSEHVKQEPVGYAAQSVIDWLSSEERTASAYSGINLYKNPTDNSTTPLYAAPVDTKAIRAKALEEAAKVADRHSTCLNDTPNVIAAAIRGLK